MVFRVGYELRGEAYSRYAHVDLTSLKKGGAYAAAPLLYLCGAVERSSCTGKAETNPLSSPIMD